MYGAGHNKCVKLKLESTHSMNLTCTASQFTNFRIFVLCIAMLKLFCLYEWHSSKGISIYLFFGVILIFQNIRILKCQDVTECEHCSNSMCKG